ncbi:MAG TPA: NADP-dependent oxidoreductase [Roseiflexaceae bacterium]|nr:NADP-dependent oxidoreductase [Roseiflexaceae bacterium]
MGSDTMKAVRIHGFGGPEQLVYEDVPRPSAGAGEVLVRIHATGINPVDWKSREGRGVAAEEQTFPLILGWDVSGTVAEVGEGVAALRKGDQVYGMIRFPGWGSAYAEYASAPVSDLALKPASVDHVQAAAVPLAALTAWQALFEFADLRPGQRVLIHAAAGGVGHLAVQLAKWRGAYVIGSASARNGALVRELGADEVIDYTAAPFEQQVRDVDVVLDAVGGETLERSLAVVRPSGVLVSIVGRPDEQAAEARGVRAGWVLVRPHAEQLAQLSQLIDAGTLRVLVETVLPLPEAAEAHRQSQSGRTRGKIVLQVLP